MGDTCVIKKPFDVQTVQAALEEAGWTPARGQGLAEGLAWLVQRSSDLEDLQGEHKRLRARLDERVDQLDESREKFRKEQKARLRLAGRCRTSQEQYAELERKFYAGWEAERDRLQTRITELEAENRRYADALSEIENSDGPPGLHAFTPDGHEWCVNRALRARKAWMPCDGCLVSHECLNAYDERNRGRIPQRDCLWSPEGEH
jgi:hypothetical protein